MINFAKKIYQKLRFLYSINWIKTIYFNFKMLPLDQAKLLPVIFYGSVKFSGLNGKVLINAPTIFGMVGFGQKYELISVSKKNAQLTINGNFIINGHIQFGIDYFVFIDKYATLNMGHLSSLGGSGKIVCFNSIIIGNHGRIGYESQVIDTSFHIMQDTLTGEEFPKTEKIIIGNYNYIGGRVSIMKSTITPNNCTVASNSLLTKNYSEFGENIMLGGIPAKLLKTNIKRAWDTEKIENFLIIKKIMSL